jgi:hypothetical protein
MKLNLRKYVKTIPAIRIDNANKAVNNLFLKINCASSPERNPT